MSLTKFRSVKMTENNEFGRINKYIYININKYICIKTLHVKCTSYK